MNPPEPLAESPAGPILLCDLAKGAQLPVLVALIRAQGLPLSNKALAEETGVRDDERLAEALFRLARRNLVVNLGHASSAHQNEWVATAVARQFFLPAGPRPGILESPAPDALPAPAESGKTGVEKQRLSAPVAPAATPEIPESKESAEGVSSVKSAESGKTGLGAPEIETVKLKGESFNQVLVSELRRMSKAAADAQPGQLEARFHVALLRGGVYRQLAGPLARTLALEDPGYLPHLLAHIAYSRSAQFHADGQHKPGAYVKLAVEQRALGDPAFTPPAGLSFEHALAWALRGGETQPGASGETQPDETQAEETQPDAPESPAAPVQTIAGPQTPDEIWQNALARLQLTTNQAIFEAWLRPVGWLGYAPEPETFTLGAPHAYGRDFLELRLLEPVRSALAAVVGRAVAVKVEVKV